MARFGLTSATSGWVAHARYWWSRGASLALLLVTFKTLAQSAPLAEIDAPGPDAAVATLWCPDCLRRPILVEAHLVGLGTRRTTSAGVESAASADLDLIVLRPVPDGGQASAACGPTAAVLSNELTKACYLDQAIAATEISTGSMGWFDIADVPRGGLYERESFYAAPSVAALAQIASAKQSWCLTSYGQQSDGDVAQAEARLEIVLEGNRRYSCMTTLNTADGGVAHNVLSLPNCSAGAHQQGRAASLEVQVVNGVACLRQRKPWRCQKEGTFKEPDACATLAAP